MPLTSVDIINIFVDPRVNTEPVGGRRGGHRGKSIIILFSRPELSKQCSAPAEPSSISLLRSNDKEEIAQFSALRATALDYPWA